MPKKKQIKTTKEDQSEFGKLLNEGTYLKIPKVGDTIKGKVISAGRREVRLDIDGYTTGVIRGRELFSEAAFYKDLKEGDEVEATVIDLENENGELELSFRFAGQKRAWEELVQAFTAKTMLPAKILEANKGGLIVRVNQMSGFLPVSQLSPDHYPRVTGGDKARILEKLKTYVGETFDVRVIDLNEREEKLIVSEKSVWEEFQKDVLSKFKVGDQIQGIVTALADFGAFVKLPAPFQNNDGSSATESLEGLIHISELDYKLIENPQEVIKVGDKVRLFGGSGSYQRNCLAAH